MTAPDDLTLLMEEGAADELGILPDDRAACDGATRAWAADYLTRRPEGPLGRIGLAYDQGVTDLAYLIHIAFIRGVTKGMLKGRKSYEARELLAHRVRAARGRADSLAGFGVRLFGLLNLDIAQMTTEDALWWRGACVQHAADWPRLSDDTTLTDAVTVSGLISTGLRALKDQ